MEGDGDDIASTADLDPSSPLASNSEEVIDAIAGQASHASPSPAEFTRTSTSPAGTPPAQGSQSDPLNEPWPAAPLQTRDPKRYTIIGEHGRGGLGRVLRAYDKELGRDIAVKELLAGGSLSEVRFFREALVTARLEHPSIVPVHEAGRWPDGTPFYAMKLVSGRSLKTLIDSTKNLEQRLALIPNVIAVADAIAYAHARRILHRDIKPSNVMIGDFGETVVIDWGLAKALDDSTTPESFTESESRIETLTLTGSVVGTPAYMAPEQLRGVADERSDIYALGGLLYTLFTGATPNHWNDHRPPFDQGVSAELAAIATKALQVDPRLRYSSASQLAADLKLALQRLPVSARRYSLVSRLGLLASRHRQATTIAFGSLFILTILLLTFLVRLRDERDISASSERRALIANAAMLLRTDPYAANKQISKLPPGDDTALLTARINGRGLPVASIEFPAIIDTVKYVPERNVVVASTGDRGLHEIALRGEAVTTVARDLFEPRAWSVYNQRLYFVRRQNKELILSEKTLGSSTITDRARLAEAPTTILANNETVHWLSRSGSLYEYDVASHSVRVIRRNIAAVWQAGSGIAICNRDGILSSVSSRGSERTLGACTGAFLWANSSMMFAYRLSNGELWTGDDHSTVLAKRDLGAISHVDISDSGALLALDFGHQVLFRDAKQKDLVPLTLSSRPTAWSINNDIVAWATLDGNVEFVNRNNKSHWEIKAHPEPVASIISIDGYRYMTVGHHEMRLWSIPRALPRTVVALNSSVSDVKFNRFGDAILDASDGSVSLLKARSDVIMPLHDHSDDAYGAAWCGDEACSNGADNHIICSRPATGASRDISREPAIVTKIVESQGKCFVGNASGAVVGVENVGDVIFQSPSELYTLAVSQDGKYIAGGDWNGNVSVFDITQKQLTTSSVHRGLISQLAWDGKNLISAGLDGNVFELSPTLEVIRGWNLFQPVGILATSAGKIAAGAADHSVLIVGRDGTTQRIEVGTVLNALAVSPSGRSVAIGTADGELIIKTDNRPNIVWKLGYGNIGCLAFKSEAVAWACSSDGHIHEINLD